MPKNGKGDIKHMASTKRKTLRERQGEGDSNKDSLARVFWRGFFWPIVILWKGLAWIVHRPPLKQIGHGLRWFFRLKPFLFIAKITGLKYLYDSLSELRDVTWPSFRESLRLTGAVIIFAIIFGFFVAIVDFGLDKVFKQILLK